MATGTKNARSQALAARVPHEIIEAMETVKLQDESTANFIVTAMRGEIVRRQMGGSAEDAILSALEAMTHIREGAAKARKELDKVIKIADKEIGE